MVRWEPGARERLQAAAMDLYLTNGFDRTTASEIAAAAGLTERSFFRHFTDKREVLFGGQDVFQQCFIDGVTAAPADAGPLDLVVAAVSAVGPFFPDEKRVHSRRRQTVIDANPALRERELLKMTHLAQAIGDALRARGVAEPAATLAAASGVTVFGVAFVQWLADGETRSFLTIQDGVMRELLALTRPGLPTPVSTS